MSFTQGGHRMRFLKLFALSIVVCMLSGTSFICAQALSGSSGTVSGEVKDESGTALPGVLVSLTGTAGSRTSTTDSRGEFIFPYVDPGKYSLRAELQSYTTIEQSDVDVRLNERTEVAFKMRPGQEELVVVTGEAPLVDESSTTAGAN